MDTMLTPIRIDAVQSDLCVLKAELAYPVAGTIIVVGSGFLVVILWATITVPS